MPSYYFYGSDEFAIEQAIHKLKQSLNVDPINSYTLRESKESGLRQTLETALTSPFGSGARFIWVQNLPSITSSHALYPLLEAVLTAPLTATHIVVSSAESPNLIFKRCSQIQKCDRTPAWKTDQLHQWIHTTAEQCGLKLHLETIQVLQQAIGNDSRALHHAIEKLILYSNGDGTQLTPVVVKELITSTTATSLDLAQAALEGNSEAALNLLDQLTHFNEPALKIIRTLSNRFRLWLCVRSLIEAGIQDNAQIAQIAEIRNSNQIYFLRQMLSKTTRDRLQACLRDILHAEFEIKSNSGNSQATLHLLVLGMCSNQN